MTASATDVKNNFGRYLEKAQKEPVTVQRSGRPHAVLISYDDFERLQALEDAFWAARAVEAEKSGYASSEQSIEFLRERLAQAAAGEPDR